MKNASVVRYSAMANHTCHATSTKKDDPPHCLRTLDDFIELAVCNHFTNDIKPSDKFAADNKLRERRPVV